MSKILQLDDITIRTELRPGDIGYITYLHGLLYQQEYQYGIAFENYVALGLQEFYRQHDPAKDRVWIGEYAGKIIGFLLLMHRTVDTAQLRFFIIKPGFRGIGLGRKLMTLYIDFLKEKKYKHSYLWTTDELSAAAYLYKKAGFTLTEESESALFGKTVREQRYDLSIH